MRALFIYLQQSLLVFEGPLQVGVPPLILSRSRAKAIPKEV
jgi:hypothetical protein